MGAKRGAPVGNQNGAKAKIWADVIRRVAMRDKGRLERLANALLKKAEEGDIAALKEIGDRLEGKPVQQVGTDNPNQKLVALVIEG